MTIRPIDNQPAVLVNKIRERLVFDVYHSLRIQDITIDSLDSLYDVGERCLSDPFAKCCTTANELECKNLIP